MQNTLSSSQSFSLVRLEPFRVFVLHGDEIGIFILANDHRYLFLIKVEKLWGFLMHLLLLLQAFLEVFKVLLVEWNDLFF